MIGNMDEWRTCSACGRELAIWMFRRRRARTEQRHRQCRECAAAYMRLYRMADGDRKLRRELTKDFAGQRRRWFEKVAEAHRVIAMVAPAKTMREFMDLLEQAYAKGEKVDEPRASGP